MESESCKSFDANKGLSNWCSSLSKTKTKGEPEKNSLESIGLTES